jgi:hypothetical protein
MGHRESLTGPVQKAPGLFLCRHPAAKPNRRPSHYVVGFPPGPWQPKGLSHGVGTIPRAISRRCTGMVLLCPLEQWNSSRRSKFKCEKVN